MTVSVLPKNEPVELKLKPKQEVLTHTLGFKATKEQAEALKRYALAYDRSYSEIIREALATLSIIPD